MNCRGYSVFVITIIILATILGHSQDPFKRLTINWGRSFNGASNTAIWFDYDGDGDLDLYVSNGSRPSATSIFNQENFLMECTGDSTFTSNLSAGGIVSDQEVTAGATAGDYDGDGDWDMFVTRAASNDLFSTNPKDNLLYINNNDKTFSSLGAGDVVSEDEYSTSAAWVDYDNDGDLDLLVKNGTPEANGIPKKPFLYQNNNGTLTAVTSAGDLLNFNTYAGAVVWCDYDNDGDQDVYLCSGGDGPYGRLFRNDGGGVFTNVVQIDSAMRDVGASWADYDNDGDFDLYIVNTGTNDNILLVNDGTGNFTIDQLSNVVNDGQADYGSAWGDFDNDGDLDLFLAVSKDVGQIIYNILYENSGYPNYTFTMITNTVAVTDTNNSRSAAWGDFNRDGFLDLAVVHWDRYNPNNIYYNLGNTNHWLQVVPRGTQTNKYGIGVRVKAKATINGNTYWQMREIQSQTGFGSQDQPWAHFGLGDATQVDSLTVYWPVSGITTVFTDVPADQFVTVVEGDLNVTYTIEAGDTSHFFFGNTGASIEFTANNDADGGDLTVVRYTTGPTNNAFSGSASAPDGSTVTPDRVATDRYWSITNNGLASFTYTISLDITNLPGVSNPDRLVIVKRADNTQPWVPVNTTRSGNRLYASGLTSFSEFAIASNTADNSLPVTLQQFNARVEDNVVVLQWVTEAEINNLGFELERSTSPAGPFVRIAGYQTHPQLKGQGNTNTRTEYKYRDTQVEPGNVYYYRLYDVDYSGQRSLIGNLRVDMSAVVTEFQLYPNYPNPFNPSTTIRFSIPSSIVSGDAPVRLAVYDAAGRLVRTLLEGRGMSGEFTVRWDGKNAYGESVSSGIYYARLQAGIYIKTQKMVLMK